MPTLTDDRILPLASISLFNPGMGDPVLDDHGFGWYGILQEEARYGTVSFDAFGRPTLELLPGIGVCCRPFFNLKDTLISQYSFSGGTWENRRPMSGTPRAQRLVQLDTSPNLAWTATSTFNLPANPSVAFSFILPDAPPDNDYPTFPPYVRLEFGGGQWAIYLTPDQGAYLLRFIGGGWQAVLELDSPPRTGYQEAEEFLVVLRCLRGQLGVSMDRGATYKWFAFGDGTPVSVAAAPFTLRGQGQMAVFGLHQVQYVAGVYQSPTQHTFPTTARERTRGAASFTGSRYLAPAGTTVAFADVGTPSTGIAQYTATLTPGTVIGTPFTFYVTPEVYTVALSYPARAAAGFGLGTSSNPFDGEIRHVGVKKPLELDAATADVVVRKDPSAVFVWNSGRWPKVAITLGEVAEDGVTVRNVVAFTGYVRPIEATQERYADTDIRFSLENASSHLRRAKWRKRTSMPLGGQSVNAAAAAIFASEGLGPAYYTWHAIGDSVILPKGAPEDPFEWPKPGEDKWETLKRIFGYAGLEPVPLDTGRFISQPKNYVDAFVAGQFSLAPSGTDAKALIDRLTFGMDSAEHATFVECCGTSEFGEALTAYGVDGDAETAVLSSRFCPWREPVVEEVGGTCDAATLVSRAQAMASELFSLKFEADLSVPVNLNILRRNRIQIQGSTTGILDADAFVVLTLEHTYEADPSFASLKTTAGCRRL